MSSYHQPINPSHMRRAASIELWAKVYTAYCALGPEEASKQADLAVEAMESRFPQQYSLSIPKEEKR